MSGQARRGFTLVELMIVLAIIALLAAIATPLSLNALNRSKQARTMANIRAIATAWEARAADLKSYNAAGATFDLPTRTISYTRLGRMLTPTYIKAVPRYDGWGNAYQFRADQSFGVAAAAQVYSIRSPGRNKLYETTTYTVGEFSRFDCDIVYSNGTFIAWPEGQQK